MHATDQHRHRRTVVATVLAVASVILLPPAAATLVSSLVPPPAADRGFLTPLAERAAGLPGAQLLPDFVVVEVDYPDRVPALADQRVELRRLVGTPRYTLREGLVPLEPDHLAGRVPSWVEALEPSDRVYASLGAVVLACVAGDGPGCTESVLTLHPSGYYRFPAELPPPGRLGTGEPVAAMVVTSVDGTLVAGQLVGDVAKVLLRTEGGTVRAATASHPGGGTTVWWTLVSSDVTGISGSDRAGAAVGTATVESWG